MPSPFNAANFLPWLVPFWSAGVILFHVRALAGFAAARRMRRRGVCSVPQLWQTRLNQLRAQIQVSRAVILLESCLTDVPVVIGYIRPAILMPVGLLTGLPVGQLESILLHELAHIRRHDYLVVLLQAFVESLLFYHPAAWWISGIIRAEREKCCDDVVVSISGDAHQYAIALATLEQSRTSVRKAALAATGGSLVNRIRRLLYQSEESRVALAPAFAAGVLTIVAAATLVGWQSRPPERPTAPETPFERAAEEFERIRSAPRPQPMLLAQAPQPAPRPAASSPYDRWLNEDVVYIISDQERAAFQALQSDEERQKFIEQFWLRRDPTPGTPENEFKEEHHRRIAYATERFATAAIAGWKTDRGRIYIVYGPPDEIESHPSGGQMTANPYEQCFSDISKESAPMFS